MTTSLSTPLTRFLERFPNYDWGTVRSVPEGIFAGPLKQDVAMALSQKVGQLVAKGRLLFQSGPCRVFKGLPLSPHSPECYYFYVIKSAIEQANLAPVALPQALPASSSSSAVVAAASATPQRAPSFSYRENILEKHPTTLLNERVRTSDHPSEKPIATKLREAFDSAQTDFDKGSNPQWDTIKIETLKCQTLLASPDRERTFHVFGTASTPGRRTYMEDVCSNEGLLDVEGRQIPFFALFDGHSAVENREGHRVTPIGSEVADYAKRKMPEYLSNTLRTTFDRRTRATQKRQTETYNAIVSAFVQTSRATHFAFERRNIESGTTATVALLLDDTLWVACAGDSRAILSTPERAIALSKDAKPYTPIFPPAEGQRVPLNPQRSADIPKESRSPYNRGAYVYQEHACARTSSGLAINRSLGHAEIPSIKEVGGINPRPTIISYPMTMHEAKGKYLVIASDGLWDKCSSNDVSRTVQALASQGKPCDVIAKNLVDRAYSAGSTDNITVLVVDLSEYQPTEAPPPLPPTKKPRALTASKGSLETDDSDNLTPTQPQLPWMSGE